MNFCHSDKGLEVSQYKLIPGTLKGHNNLLTIIIDFQLYLLIPQKKRKNGFIYKIY